MHTMIPWAAVRADRNIPDCARQSCHWTLICMGRQPARRAHLDNNRPTSESSNSAKRNCIASTNGSNDALV